MFCESIKNLDQEINGLIKLRVDENYMVDIDGIKQPLDVEIRERGLPALIYDKTVYIGEKHIIEFVKKFKSGEL